jgi:hypothetical protein
MLTEEGNRQLEGARGVEASLILSPTTSSPSTQAATWGERGNSDTHSSIDELQMEPTAAVNASRTSPTHPHPFFSCLCCFESTR